MDLARAPGKSSGLRAAPMWVGGVVLALASVAFCLALAEGMLRLHERSLPARAPAPDAEALPELKTVSDLARPNAFGRYKGQVYRNNRHGFRGPVPAQPKPAGTFRIAVIGDSVTMGDGVAAEEAYAARLERILDPVGGGRFEVINLGISGTNLRHNLDSRLPIGLRFEPDLLIYGFTINDLETLPGYRVTQRAPYRETAWRVLRFARLFWIVFAERHALPGSYRAELEENYFDNPAVWTEFESDLARLARTGRVHGTCVEVFLHAHLGDPRGWIEPVYERVERAARRRGLHVTSSLPVFDGIDVERLWVAPLDPHPNAEGHRLLAEALGPGLASLPEACWKGAQPAIPLSASESGSR